jgi:photosystem I P700 chlorophyll a apoprotein A1
MVMLVEVSKVFNYFLVLSIMAQVVLQANFNSTAIGGLVMAAAMFFAGWFHYHKSAPKLEWFQNVESMLNHHLAGLLGLGSLALHQIHVSLPINKLLDAGVDPKEIPLPMNFTKS